MKFHSFVRRGTASKTVVVELGPEDQGRTDRELIDCADHNYQYDKEWPRNFGGSVERLPNNYARITVYTD